MNPPQTKPPTKPNLPPPSSTNGNKLKQLTNVVVPKFSKSKAEFKPPRIVLNCVEGWGKTSAIAFAPNAAIVQIRGETGYETLLGAGRVPQIDDTTINTWSELLALLDDLNSMDDKLPHQIIGFDALNGIERLCHEHVCRRDYNNDWGDTGFASYQKGYDTALTDWIGLLAKLDKLKDKGITIVLTSHYQIKDFKNPVGADFDKYIADLHKKTWSLTHRWADAVLFGTFLTIVDKVDTKGKKGKGIGGTERVLYTEHRDTFDAKNRYGMPDVIEIPEDPSQIWNTIWQHIEPNKRSA